MIEHEALVFGIAFWVPLAELFQQIVGAKPILDGGWRLARAPRQLVDIHPTLVETQEDFGLIGFPPCLFRRHMPIQKHAEDVFLLSVRWDPEDVNELELLAHLLRDPVLLGHLGGPSTKRAFMLAAQSAH